MDDKRFSHFSREFYLSEEYVSLPLPYDLCPLPFWTSIEVQTALPDGHDLGVQCEISKFRYIELLRLFLTQLPRIVIRVSCYVIRMEPDRGPYASRVSRGKRDGIGRGLRLRADVYHANAGLQRPGDNFAPILVVGRELDVGVRINQPEIHAESRGKSTSPFLISITRSVNRICS